MQRSHIPKQAEQMSNIYVNPYGMMRLNPMFRPGQYDVICARGKMAYNHEGNKYFRALVKQYQKQYSAATSKHDKSKIVSFIVSSIRSASREGGFIKNIDGSWFEVGDRHAKEKVGQTFRDLLHTKYSSSTKAKARSRTQKRTKDSDTEEETAAGVIRSKNELVPNRNPSSSRGDETRSSASVVSNGSVDATSDATTVVNSNKGLPPLPSSVVINKRERHQSTLILSSKLISPSCSQRSNSSRLAETLRGNVDPLAAPSFSNATMALPPADLDPLPLSDASVKVNFTDRPPKAPYQFELEDESFDEDIMNEFCQNMGVAV